MTAPVELLPCPFCAGPPKPFIGKALGGKGSFTDVELAVASGVYAEATVFCHECGAQSEAHSGDVYDRDDCRRLLGKAVESWNLRDQRNRDLFDASVRDGLNVWPKRSSATSQSHEAA